MVVGTTGEGAAVASVLSVGLGSASHFVGDEDKLRRVYGLCSLGQRVFSQHSGVGHDK
jgi:hypothetical protein